MLSKPRPVERQDGRISGAEGVSGCSRRTARPSSVTWWYQSSLPSTVIETRGSSRRCSSRLRPSSMFTSTRPSSHRYQVAAVCGLPSSWMVAITEGLGWERNSSSSCGRGGFGTVSFAHVQLNGADRSRFQTVVFDVVVLPRRLVQLQSHKRSSRSQTPTRNLSS